MAKSTQALRNSADEAVGEGGTVHPETNSREARRLATRETITRAAAEGFARRGYEHCSLDEIAQAAGVSKGLLLYHFRSKDEMLEAVERTMFTDLLERVKRTTAGVGTSLDQALWAMDQAWERLKTEEAFLSIYLQAALRAGRDSQPGHSPASRFMNEHREIMVDGARTTLGPLVDALPIDIDSLADILLATLSGLAIERIQGGDPERAERSYVAFRNLLKLAMGAR